MSSSVDEPTAAQLLLQLVVTVIDHHHRRAHELGQVVVLAVRELGTPADNPDWVSLISTYDALATALVEHMHEEEEMVLERVQVLHAQGRLVFGALAAAAETITALEVEHQTLRVLGARLSDQLEASRGTLSLKNPRVHTSLVQFARALDAHLAFEERALAPVLAPFATNDLTAAGRQELTRAAYSEG
jgi:Hemerythrin HHE cation binding domain